LNFFPPYVRADEYVIIPQFINYIKGFGGDNSMYPSNFVTYFPAGFK